MENKRKHLEFIECIINRMAGNSFFLKGWTLTLILALLAFFIKNISLNYIFIVYIPIIIFWILDGYFLSQERLFRALYDDVRKLDEKDINFSMDVNEYKKELSNNRWNSTFSSTLALFYLVLIVIMSLITYLI